MGHTQHRWATPARPRAAGHLCHRPGAGPTILHSEMVHGVGKKPQLAQLPTKRTQSPISKRTESGSQLHGADPTKKGNKKGNTTKNKNKSHTTPMISKKLMVKKKKKKLIRSAFQTLKNGQRFLKNKNLVMRPSGVRSSQAVFEKIRTDKTTKVGTRRCVHYTLTIQRSSQNL